jgi:hypothetical protein
MTLDPSSAMLRAIEEMQRTVNGEFRTIRENVQEVSLSVAEIHGELKAIRAEKPGRDEISTLINTAIQACPGQRVHPRERGDISGTHPRPAMISGDAIAKIVLASIALATTAVAIVAAVKG